MGDPISDEDLVEVREFWCDGPDNSVAQVLARLDTLAAKLAAAEAERDQWKDDADHFAVQSIGQMQRADRFLAEKAAAEAQAERYREALEHGLRALLDEGLPPITAEATALEALCKGLGYAS